MATHNTSCCFAAPGISGVGGGGGGGQVREGEGTRIRTIKIGGIISTYVYLGRTQLALLACRLVIYTSTVDTNLIQAKTSTKSYVLAVGVM